LFKVGRFSARSKKCLTSPSKATKDKSKKQNEYTGCLANMLTLRF
jgi:hypothetical protein